MKEKPSSDDAVRKMAADAQNTKTSGPMNADLVARWLQEQGLDGIPDMDLGPDTGEEGRPFLDSGVMLFGYDRVVIKNNKIVALRSAPDMSALISKPTVKVGDQIVLEGDSRGYVPSGHPPDSMVTILGFREPFQGHSSDRIILVSDGKTAGWVKPSNIAS